MSDQEQQSTRSDQEQQSILQLESGGLKYILKTPTNTPVDQLKEIAAGKCGVSQAFVLQYYDDYYNNWIVVDEDYQLSPRGKLKLIQQTVSIFLII